MPGHATLINKEKMAELCALDKYAVHIFSDSNSERQYVFLEFWTKIFYKFQKFFIDFQATWIAKAEQTYMWRFGWYFLDM